MDENKRLALRLKKHDEEALDRIIARFTPLAAKIILNISNGALSDEDVEEAVSDTFVALWKNADRFDPEHLTGYICAVAKSKAFDRLRGKNSAFVIEADEDLIGEGSEPDNIAETNEIIEALKQGVNDLPETDREIIIRHYFYYQKVADISSEMGIPSATVKVRLHRARKKLKKYLTERGFAL